MPGPAGGTITRLVSPSSSNLSAAAVEDDLAMPSVTPVQADLIRRHGGRGGG